MENNKTEINYQASNSQNSSQQIWQQQLPNSNTVLVLGIISVTSSFWLGLIGLTLGIIALVSASKASKIYHSNPSLYSISSYSNLKAGKICAIVGVCISAIHLIIVLTYIALIATFASRLM